jgi:hypothetical protein
MNQNFLYVNHSEKNGLMDDIYSKYHVDTIEEALKSFECLCRTIEKGKYGEQKRHKLRVKILIETEKTSNSGRIITYKKDKIYNIGEIRARVMISRKQAIEWK